MPSKSNLKFLDKNKMHSWPGLTGPAKIQAFLGCHPLQRLGRKPLPAPCDAGPPAHCLDGGLFAAAALRRQDVVRRQAQG